MRAHAFRAAIGVAAVSVGLLTAACGKSANESGASTSATTSSSELSATMPAGTGPVDSVTWAMYRDTITVDPIFSGDYPERQVTALMCESLLRQSPDGVVEDGLARLSYPDPRTIVFTLRDDVTFWDGSPMTADDVVYSIDRNRDPRLGGYWIATLSSIDTVAATGRYEVTIRLKRPDYFLESEFAVLPGMVVKKDFAEPLGRDYGSPSGRAMCTGGYKLGAWRGGSSPRLVRNDDYWNRDVELKVREIQFRGVPDHSALTAGLLTGEIDGTYPLGLATLDQLRRSDAVEVYEGPSYMIAAAIVNLDGPLGDRRVRNALSLALDREGIIATTFKGTAQPARALASPGTWGYGRSVFESAWDALPEPTQDIAAARRLVEEAGAAGEEITIATSAEIANIDIEANQFRTAAEAIGLRVRMASFPATVYSGLFTDLEARRKVDMFSTMNYTDRANPAALYSSIAYPDGSQNYYGYRAPAVVAKLEQARGTADPDERARYVTEAQALITEEQPWIQTVSPYTVLVMSSELTGAVVSSTYLTTPWANELGARG